MAVFVLSSANPVLASEIIRNFHSDIHLDEKGMMLVKETIVYDFGDAERHGIFRDIPVKSKGGPHLAIEVLGVKDEFGGDYPFTVSVKKDVVHVKIGDPDQLVSGQKTYSVEYSVWNAIREFPDHDELYWNVTGNGWEAPIEAVSAGITLPEKIKDNVSLACFAGPEGSTATDCVTQVNLPTASVSGAKLLDPRSGLTFSLSVPPTALSIVYVPGTKSDNTDILILVALILPVILFVVLIGKLILRRFNLLLPKELRNRPMAVEYHPPRDLQPIDNGVIYDGTLDNADLGSVIIDLAVKGYLKVRYTEDEDYEFIKVENPAPLTHPAYTATYDYIFKDRDRVTISELKKAKVPFDRIALMTSLKAHLQTNGVLKGKGSFDWRRFADFIKILLAIFGAYLIAFYFLSGGWENPKIIFVSLLIAGLFSVFATIMLALVLYAKLPYGNLAAPGIAALGAIIGFREFLHLTDRDKLRLLNAPELKPELFERYLPFAMALRVEKQWAKKFEGLYLSQPQWFEGPQGSFNPALFMGQIHSLNKSFGQVTGVYSSGSSGGFSGGGSGGGGGGSW